MEEERRFCEILREYRLKNNMQQKELAKLLGMAAHTISRYEHGDFMPAHYATYVKISDILNIPMELLYKSVCLKNRNMRMFREEKRYKNSRKN